MDQAMGDMQNQLDEVKRLWDEERMARQRAESELEVLRNLHSGRANGSVQGPGYRVSRSRSPDEGGLKRRGDGQGDGGGAEDRGEGSGKRQRVDDRREL
jgi:hypothetical protein